MFYELRVPDYATDHEQDYHNPIVDADDTYRLPSITCPRCGRWASVGTRIRESGVREALISRFPRGSLLQLEDWLQLSERIVKDFNVNARFIEPAAEVGPPRGELVKGQLNDFVHLFPGQIWITERVYCALSSAKFGGARYIPAEVSTKLCVEPPRLWEIYVEANAWRKGSSLDALTDCEICGHYDYGDAFPQVVDFSTWDGSDFFNLDCNPNYVIVTQRVADLLGAGGFNNYRLVAIPSDS